MSVLAVFLNIPLVTFVTCGFFALVTLGVSYCQDRRVQVTPIPREQWIWEVKATTSSVLVDACFYLLVSRTLTLNYDFDANLGQILSSYCFMVLWFDLWFYSWHRLFHQPGFYRWHMQHHRSIVTTPFSAHSFSILERAHLNLGIMLPVIVLSYWKPMPFYGHAMYLYTILLWNNYGHSNVEFLPKSWSQRWPLRYLFTPTEHSLHHIFQTGNYGLVFRFWDRIFKTQLENLQIEKGNPRSP